MGVIKAEYWRMKLPAGAKRGPSEVIRIARLDDVGPDVVEDVVDQLCI